MSRRLWVQVKRRVRIMLSKALTDLKFLKMIFEAAAKCLLDHHPRVTTVAM